MLHSETNILIDAIVLLLHKPSIQSKHAVKELLTIFNYDKTILEKDKIYVSLYKDIITDIMSNDIVANNKNELYRLITAHQNHTAALNDSEAYNRLSTIILNEEDIITEAAVSLSSDKIYTKLLWYKLHYEYMKLGGELRKCGDCNDLAIQKEYMNNIWSSITKMSNHYSERYTSSGDAPGQVESIDMSNKESIKKALANYKFTNIAHVVKTGWQGLNMMLGERGGFKLGESVCFAALSHNGKSYMLLSCALWMAKYNVPPPADKGGKPAIIFVSLENEANENMMWLFKHIYMMEEQKPCGNLPDEEIVEYIFTKFEKYGYVLFIEKYMAQEFGYDEFVTLMESKKAAGFRVYGAIVDYANNMKKTSIISDGKERNDLLVRNLYNSLCNYTKANNILFITAHQLNRDAEFIAGSGNTNKVKRFNGSHFADAMDVQREVDLTIFCHIEKNHLGNPYFTFARGKHRYVENTPEAHKYFAYKFTPLGIFDDVNGTKGFTRDIFDEVEEIMPAVELSSADVLATPSTPQSESNQVVEPKPVSDMFSI